MKTVITLDPEYIPWEPGNPVVRLRRRRNKTLSALVGIGFMILIFGGGVFMSSRNKPATPVAPQAAAPAPTSPATPYPEATPALITRGQPGKLAVIRGNVVTFYTCTSYSVRAAGDELAHGDTVAGPIVDASGRQEVVIECENQIYELP